MTKIKLTEDGKRKIQEAILTNLNSRQRKQMDNLQLSVIATTITNIVESGRFTEEA